MQFMFAADRGNTRVADRFDPISPPMLRALEGDRRQGDAAGKPVTLCGELASKPIGALALVAIGYRSLSLSPSAVGPVKAMLLDLDAKQGRGSCCARCSSSRSGSMSIREQLEAFAEAERAAAVIDMLPEAQTRRAARPATMRRGELRASSRPRPS